MIKGSGTTWCYVTDMNKAVDFYRDFLGLTPRVITPYWSDFKIGESKIGLHPGRKPGETYANWTLGLETEDLKSLRQKAIDSEVKILDVYHATPEGVVLTFADPDGNHIQVIQPGSRISDFN